MPSSNGGIVTNQNFCPQRDYISQVQNQHNYFHRVCFSDICFSMLTLFTLFILLWAQQHTFQFSPGD